MRRLLLALVVAAAACTSTPTAPRTFTLGSAAPDLAGEWRGLFEITACAGEPSDCGPRITAEFMLTLAPAGAGLEGVLVLLDNLRTTIELTGAAGPDGSFAFTPRPHLQAGSSPSTTVSSIALRTDPAAGLTGSIVYTTHTFRTFTRTAAFRSAVRQAAADRPGNFHGSWQGYFRTLSCAGECKVGAGGYNHPTGGSVNLTLSEAAGQVVGSMMFHTLTGTAQADTITLTGPALTGDLCQTCWDCEGVCQTSVRNINARIDKLGRMTGTFEYARKGWTGSDHFRQIMQVEMVGVTRRW